MDLKVLPLPPKPTSRLSGCKADRVVVLLAVQLDACESIGVELEAIAPEPPFMVEPTPTQEPEFAKNVVALAADEEELVLGADATAPVPALISWSDSAPIRVSPVSDPEISSRVAIRD